MWIFAAYELLRTWRQFVREIKKEAAGPAAEVPPECEFARELADVFWKGHVEQARTDPEFVKSLDDSMVAVERVFRRIEALRMNLAKHEVKGRDELAMAPGYGRLDEGTGSMLWFVDLGDKNVDMVSRRDLAEELRRAVIGKGLEPEDDEEEVVEARPE